MQRRIEAYRIEKAGAYHHDYASAFNYYALKAVSWLMNAFRFPM